MKKYTCEDALKEVFKMKDLPMKIRVYKHRYTNGKLAQKAIDEILEEYGFEVIQPTLYRKKLNDKPR